MTIDEIRWMLELFETGKMSKAAENLYISQPALSQCVQRIEQQLGFRLFERSNKGLNPTPTGQLFYEAAVDITATYQHFLTRAELLELFQWSGTDLECREKLPQLREELADVLSYCILLADVCGLDLDEIMTEKVDKNEAKYPGDRARGRSAKYTEL